MRGSLLQPLQGYYYLRSRREHGSEFLWDIEHSGNGFCLRVLYFGKSMAHYECETLIRTENCRTGYSSPTYP